MSAMNHNQSTASSFPNMPLNQSRNRTGTFASADSDGHLNVGEPAVTPRCEPDQLDLPGHCGVSPTPINGEHTRVDTHQSPRPLEKFQNAVEDIVGHKIATWPKGHQPTFGNEDLWIAALKGDSDMVKQCIDSREADINFPVEACDDFSLEYKGRKFTAKCIHAAARFGHKEVLKQLLDNKANVNDEAVSVDKKQKRVCKAVHLAAGSGGKDVMKLLLEAGANANEEAVLYDPSKKVHYYPIHDAAWCNQADTMLELINHKAEHDRVNFQGWTALHIAAKLGNEKIVEYLLGKIHDTSDKSKAHLRSKDKQRLLKMKDEDGKTAIELAVKSGYLKAVKLHHFTDPLDAIARTMAFMKVAKHCPTSVPYLLRSTCESKDIGSELSAPIDKEWKNCFHGEAGTRFTVHDLAHLIIEAPQAFMDVLETLTDVPEIENAGHNSLPIRARLSQSSEHCAMACEYRPEIKWEWERQHKTQSKAWHRSFAPVDPRRGKEVQVKVVKMKGLADLEVVFFLAVASDLRVFTKLSIHALLRYIWSKLQWIYFLDLAHELSAVTVLSLWAAQKDWMLSLSAGTQQALWCLPASFALVDFYMLIWGAISLSGTIRAKNGIANSEEKDWTWKRFAKKARKHLVLIVSFLCLYPHRVIMSSLTMVLSAMASGSFETNSDTELMLSVCIWLHWVLLLVRLRAFPLLGRKLLPIMRSVVQVSGMGFILVFLTLGFLHAYWSLELDSAGGSFIYEIVAFLFTGEPFQALGSLEDLSTYKRNYIVLLSMIALFIFPCCALNVFIAVLADTYDSEQESVCCTFLRERARICLIMFLRPKIKLGMPYTADRWRWIVWLFYGVFIVALHALMFIGLLHASTSVGLDGSSNFTVWAPACVIAVLFLVLQSIMRASLTQRWEDLHLWFCHEASIEEASFLTAADRSNSADGRLTRIRTEVERLRKDLTQKLAGLRWSTHKRDQQQPPAEPLSPTGTRTPQLISLDRGLTAQSNASRTTYDSRVGTKEAAAHPEVCDDQNAHYQLSSYTFAPQNDNVKEWAQAATDSITESLAEVKRSLCEVNERLGKQEKHFTAKLDKVQGGLDEVNKRLDGQQEQFQTLMKLCLETNGKLQDVINATQKKDKDKKSSEGTLDRPSHLAPLQLRSPGRSSVMTFGAQPQTVEEKLVPPLSLPSDESEHPEIDSGASRLQSPIEVLVPPPPPPAAPPPEPLHPPGTPPPPPLPPPPLEQDE